MCTYVYTGNSENQCTQCALDQWITLCVKKWNLSNIRMYVCMYVRTYVCMCVVYMHVCSTHKICVHGVIVGVYILVIPMDLYMVALVKLSYNSTCTSTIVEWNR